MPMFRRYPRRRDIPGILFILLLLAGVFYLNLKYPNWKRPTGFGPEWECLAPGRIGSSFCVRKPTVDPANQTATPN
jgi:hypothetical protein